ncbi:MAG TPA: serine/threonine-protein kinase [Polyangiaceae bacterium]|nr:serine/threonine-protein kinase [Polyangiaceae bacterium]
MHPASDPPRDLFVGQVLESAYQPGVSYRLEKKLGEGGTALAYLTRRISAVGESQAVIKIILPQVVAESDERALTIIKKEAVALGRLNERVPPTPFVVRLLDTGSVAFQSGNRLLQLPFIALEYVHGGLEGATLEERVEYSVKATGFSFDPERAARLIRGLAKGLDEIHAVDVVHRDLSPANILCCGSGETELFKISDFGIARPIGLSATFGNMLVGTPGYLAPEQIISQGGDSISACTDIFSFAAIVYYVLTGDPLFPARTAVAALMLSRAPERRSLLDAAPLPYELREREAACQAIDLAIARATSLDPKLRPQSAQRFADSLLPWLESRSTRPSRRWVSSMDPLRSRELVLETQWMVRHPPGDERLVLSVAWNAAGHALAVTTQGLAYWDGTRWCQLASDKLPSAGSLRVVERLTPASWVIGGSNATLLEYSRDGVRELLRGPDREVTFSALTPGFDDIAVVLGDKPGCPPLLYALVGKHWLRPLPVSEASMITALARIDDERWLIVGRGHDARPYAAYYRPLDWQLDRLPVADGRALLACASTPSLQTAIAVGVGGASLELENGLLNPRPLADRPDLSCIAIDTLSRHWAAGPGRVWSRQPSGEWKCVWHHAAWQPPFVSIMAEIGAVIAMTVDGAVLECRSSLLDKTYPALPAR